MIVKLQAGDYTAFINSERGANCVVCIFLLPLTAKISCFRHMSIPNLRLKQVMHIL